ncbi:MAG: hypothetical protein IJ727_09195 [Treponema sp.]|nr:hypothetical protein [Treponema sp.]
MTFVKKALIMIGVPVALFFVLTIIVVSNRISGFTQLQSYRLMYSSVRECVLNFERTLIEPAKMVDSLACFFEEGFYKSDSENQDIFEKMSRSYPEFTGFYGCRTDGTMFYGENINPPAGYDPLSSIWYEGAVENGGMTFYSPVHDNELTGNAGITIAKAIFKNESLDGVVAFDFPILDLQNFVGEVKTDDDDISFILSQEGDFFMHPTYTHHDNIHTVEDGAYSQLGEELLLSGDDFVTGKIRGVKYMFRIVPIPLTSWYYVMAKRMQDVESFSSAARHLLIFAFVFIFVDIMAVTAFVINRMRSKERGASERLIDETQYLAASSKENATTAQDQSTAVKEIVATMEDNTALSEDISQKIKDVSSVAQKTNADVAKGVSYLEENVRQLHEIAEANKTTIDGIKALGDKIENIWDIVTLINSVADQAKIIAFNAELEASTAGEAGRNFHIVATEIRRLADGIIDGTKEIKEKITEIQESSDSLILASESGTEKIQSGVSNAKSLEERFTSIKNASEITAASSGDITTIIQQQAVASEQILVTLKQISDGVDKFKGATESISVASQKLQTIAEELAD